MTPACVGSTSTVVEPRIGARDDRPDERERGAGLPLEAAGAQRMPGRRRSTTRRSMTELMPRTALATGTSRLPALSRAICPIARWKKTSLPGTSVQVVAAVRRLVDADAGLGVAGGVRLAGAGVDGVAGGIARIDQQRADRVRPEAAGHELPVRAR